MTPIGASNCEFLTSYKFPKLCSSAKMLLRLLLRTMGATVDIKSLVQYRKSLDLSKNVFSRAAPVTETAKYLVSREFVQSAIH